MDYTEQVEKILNYLKLSCDFDDIEALLKFKKNFNNDLNLIGCFLKDYLMMKNKDSFFDDEKLYDNFIIYFEKQDDKKVTLIDILKYSKYYLMIIFENFDDALILSSVSTINLCYALDCYPLIMKYLDYYYSHIINRQNLLFILQSVSNAVLNRYESPEIYDIDFYKTKIDLNGTIYYENHSTQGVAV